jgi:hypothetical protein
MIRVGLSRIRILIFYPSRIQGSKKGTGSRIRNTELSIHVLHRGLAEPGPAATDLLAALTGSGLACLDLLRYYCYCKEPTSPYYHEYRRLVEHYLTPAAVRPLTSRQGWQ